MYNRHLLFYHGRANACFLIYLIAAFSRLAKLFSCLTRPFSKQLPAFYDEWKPGELRKLLLVGYNGARNTGSDVRTAAIARQLKMLFGPGEIRITVMTQDPGTMKGYFDEDVDALRMMS